MNNFPAVAQKNADSWQNKFIGECVIYSRLFVLKTHYSKPAFFINGCYYSPYKTVWQV